MSKTPETNDVLTALRQLSVAEIEERMVALDSERAALSLLRRSLIARERARTKAAARAYTHVEVEGSGDE